MHNQSGGSTRKATTDTKILKILMTSQSRSKNMGAYKNACVYFKFIDHLFVIKLKIHLVILSPCFQSWGNFPVSAIIKMYNEVVKMSTYVIYFISFLHICCTVVEKLISFALKPCILFCAFWILLGSE